MQPRDWTVEILVQSYQYFEWNRSFSAVQLQAPRILDQSPDVWEPGLGHIFTWVKRGSTKLVHSLKPIVNVFALFRWKENVPLNAAMSSLLAGHLCV